MRCIQTKKSTGYVKYDYSTIQYSFKNIFLIMVSTPTTSKSKYHPHPVPFSGKSQISTNAIQQHNHGFLNISQNCSPEDVEVITEYLHD